MAETIKYYLTNLDILSYADEGVRELMRKVNFTYNQVDRLDNPIISMLNEPFNEMKWKISTSKEIKDKVNLSHLLRRLKKV